MLKCAKIGAVPNRSVIAASLMTMGLLFASMPANSTELGNAFGQNPAPEAEKASADAQAASAQALGALAKIFDGLRMRELKQAGSDEALRAGANQLAEASAAMRAVDTSPLKSIQFDIVALPSADAGIIRFAFTNFGRPLVNRPVEMAEAYVLFADMTQRLAESLIKQIDTKQPVLPEVSGEIALYIQYGATISRIALSRQ